MTWWGCTRSAWKSWKCGQIYSSETVCICVCERDSDNAYTQCMWVNVVVWHLKHGNMTKNIVNWVVIFGHDGLTKYVNCYFSSGVNVWIHNCTFVHDYTRNHFWTQQKACSLVHINRFVIALLLLVIAVGCWVL